MVDKIFLLQQQTLKNFHSCSWFNKIFPHVPQFNMEVIVKKAIELFKQKHYFATGHSFFLEVYVSQILSSLSVSYNFLPK